MKVLIALLAVGLLSSPAFADFSEFRRCEQSMKENSYAKQYDFGKFAARLWQQMLRSSDWTPEEKAEISPKGVTSRNSMITSASIAMMMFHRKGKPFEVDQCLMGTFRIFDRAWSGAHSGFVDYLSPELKSLYFSLPER